MIVQTNNLCLIYYLWCWSWITISCTVLYIFQVEQECLPTKESQPENVFLREKKPYIQYDTYCMLSGIFIVHTH
jgi:hypothetical protein